MTAKPLKYRQGATKNEKSSAYPLRRLLGSCIKYYKNAKPHELSYITVKVNRIK